MKRWQQTTTIVIMLMILMCVIAGCGKVNASPSDMDTLSFQKDGRIMQTIVDDFDQNYYDVDELSAMTQKKIDLYSDDEDDIVCEAVEENDGMVTVKISYKTDSDYTDFNDRELFFGTVKEASTAGYAIKDMVVDNGESISDATLEQIENNHVAIIQTVAGEELGVNVYGKILYVSSEVTQSGKKGAIIHAGEADKLSCIVFQ